MSEKNIIFVLDQDESSRSMLVSLLSKRGYETHASATGSDGLKQIRDVIPQLIICDTKLPDLGIPELAERLSSSSNSAFIPIVAISGQTNPQELEMCRRAGCMEYFAKSGLSLMELVNIVPKIIASAEAKAVTKSPGGLLVVFLSAKGGAGTSSLCANISMCLAKNIPSSTVALADMVLPMGSIASIVGYEGAFNIVDVANLSTPELTQQYLNQNLVIPPNWNVHLLPGCADPEHAEKLNVRQIPDIISALTAHYGYTLVDFGRALSRISIPIIQKADVVVIVLSTDLSTAKLTKRLCDYLKTQGVDQQRLFLILNRSVGLEGLPKTEAEQIIGQQIRMTVPYMTSDFTLANNLHTPVPVKYPTNTVTMMLNQAAADISSLAIKNHENRK